MAGVQVFAALAVAALRFDAAVAAECPPAGFSTVSDFDVNSFVSKRWYIQEQMQTKYLEGTNFCVHADYKLLPKKSFWGYDIQVHNFAAEDAPPHKPRDSGNFLCAKIVNATAGQLAVAPCFLPSPLAGPYWVIAYDESAGYALISGGAPTESAPGGCRTGTGVNNAGLWIFTRDKQRDEKLVQKARQIAQEKGFDLSVLNFVNQTVCSDGSVDPETARAAPQLSTISNPFLVQKSTFTV